MGRGRLGPRQGLLNGNRSDRSRSIEVHWDLLRSSETFSVDLNAAPMSSSQWWAESNVRMRLLKFMESCWGSFRIPWCSSRLLCWLEGTRLNPLSATVSIEIY